MEQLTRTALHYPHELPDLLKAESVDSKTSWQERAGVVYFLGLQAAGIEGHRARSYAFSLANGPVGADILPHKYRFGRLVTRLGYGAPRSILVGPKETANMAELRHDITLLDQASDERFCKPLTGTRGRGARIVPSPVAAAEFAASRTEPYLVQTVERPHQDWRYIIHRSTGQLDNGQPLVWRVAFQKVRPCVTGDGKKNIAALVRDHPDMPLSSKRQYLRKHRADRDNVPADQEVRELIITGNVSQGAYGRLPTEYELSHIDQFMGQFIAELETELQTALGTLCVDFGVRDTSVFTRPYDFKRMKDSVVFYEHQLPFGMNVYLRNVSSETTPQRKSSLAVRTRNKFAQAQLHQRFMRSVVRSGIALQMATNPRLYPN